MQKRRLFFVLALATLIGGAAFAQRLTQDVTLVMSSPVYHYGDLVEFTITNGSDSTLTFTWQPSWTIYSVTSGEPVTPEPTMPTETYLEPGEFLTWQWDQMSGGSQVPAGNYRVETSFAYGTYGTGGGETLTATFEVRDPSPTQDATWGRLRDLWR